MDPGRTSSTLIAGCAALAAFAAVTVAVTPSATAAAGQSGIVVDGHARFEVLSPTLVRMEYAADDHFEDSPTFNVVDRVVDPPTYETRVEGGDRVITTGALTLRYHRGGGPFSPSNTSVTLTRAGGIVAHPTFDADSCAVGVVCEAEAGQLFGGAHTATDHTGYTGSSFVAGLKTTGAGVTVAVSGDAGDYELATRYSNFFGNIQQTQTMSLSVDGGPPQRVSFPSTGSWNNWAVQRQPLKLTQGRHSLTWTCAGGDTCNINIDSSSLVRPGTDPSPAPASSQVGGWYRGLDSYDGQAGPPSGIKLHQGLLDRAGYYLLDDSSTAVQRSDGSYAARPGHAGQPYQDGYFFGYGQDYKQALRDLRLLTGPAPLLPEWAFGFWYSNRYAQSADTYEKTFLPKFRAEQVPIDLLTLDTDWKASDNWNGWSWNKTLYPDPQQFLDWAKSQNLQLMLNIHPSIDQNDPQFASAQKTAGGALRQGTCHTNVPCDVFDWSDPAQTAAYFGLHQPFEQQGVRQWWLDWCCDESKVSMPGVTPDTYINQLYRQETDRRGLRGFAVSRIGASYPEYNKVYPSGAWAEHRSTVHFTGDTAATWDSLSFASYLTASEGATIGLPYVSHDVGSFLGGQIADDYYLRWLQFATFQPIFRVHGHGDRLPWSYPGATKDAAEKFIRLREALVPYSYSLAAQANQTGIPMVRAMYLNYPQYDQAYTYKTQYLYGDDVLVAPITTPNDASGHGSVSVWFPPGRWTDYFTGQTYTGPSTRTITAGLGTMPVFLKAGAVVPERTDYVDNVDQRPLDQVTLDVAPGAPGRFNLYEDAGEGNGNEHGRSATTPIHYVENANGPGHPTSTVVIGGQRGQYPGRVTERAWTVRFVDTDKPTTVTVNGHRLDPTETGAGWSYDSQTRVLTVRTDPIPTRANNTTIAHD